MKKFIKKFSKIFLSCGGIGFFPYFPGSVTSVVALILFYFLEKTLPLDIFFRISFLTVAFASVFAISLFFIYLHETPKKADFSWITIDEFLGMFIAISPFFFFEASFWWWGALFWIFRFFDIQKPLGIKQLDAHQKAFFVIADDLLAGGYSVCVFFLLLLLYHFGPQELFFF